MEPLQEIVTPLEKYALEIARIFEAEGPKMAAARLNALSIDLQLPRWGVLAIRNIATSIIHGKIWKKE